MNAHSRYSIGAVPRLVAPVAPVRFRVAARDSRLAQLVERKTLNLVVVGSSPTVGDPPPLLWRSWQRVGLIILRSRVRSSPGAFTIFNFISIFYFQKEKKKLLLIGEGFEPSPPKRLVP